MPLVAPPLLLLALALAPAPAQAAEARLRACGDERAVFEGRMRALPDAQRLQMRFLLQVQEPGRPRWRPVRAPGWRAWAQGRPGARSFVFTRVVERLVGPARYRAVVRFRWLDEDGTVLVRERRASPPCRQEGPGAALHWMT